MNQFIDAIGKACPTPVILAKKEIDQGNFAFTVAVDNEVAVANLKKLAENQVYSVNTKNVDAKEEIFHVSFSGKATCSSTEKPLPLPTVHTEDWALFVGKDYIGGGLGDGAEELGNSLMKMFFYTLDECNSIPQSILFMNSGVKLPALDDQVISHLQSLQKKGTEVLVCGTCLKFYEIADQLKTGSISNMYDITEKMHKAAKVITL